MVLKKLVMGSVAAGVLASSAVANAGDIEANVAFSTDYMFRGFTQTNNDPAISGGFDYSSDSGFYAGIWASNVNFGSNTSTEIDLYGGYAFEVAEGVELDLSYIYFVYPGETSSLNYSEFTAGLSLNENLGLGLVYSPDYFGSDEDAIIVNVDYSIGVAENLSLDLHAGYSSVSSDGGFFAEDLDDYLDYSIGLSTSLAGVDLSLTYVDNDISGSIAEEIGAEERVVFSIGK